MIQDNIVDIFEYCKDRLNDEILIKRSTVSKILEIMHFDKEKPGFDLYVDFISLLWYKKDISSFPIKRFLNESNLTRCEMLKLWGYMSRSIEKPYKAYRSNCLVYEYLFGSGSQNIQECPNPDTFAQLLSQKLVDLEDYNVMIVDFFMYLEKPIRRSEA